METVYLESFEKDLRKLKEKKIKSGLLNVIEQIKTCESMTDIKNLKKIKGVKAFYRVKIGNYRLGIKIQERTVTFIRFLHRKEIYRFFP